METIEKGSDFICKLDLDIRDGIEGLSINKLTSIFFKSFISLKQLKVLKLRI